MLMTQIGTNYGGGLFELAADENLSEEILTQLQVLSESFSQEPGFLRLLGTHSIPKAERCKIVDDSFAGNVHPYVVNFLKILTEKGYVRHFQDCCQAYRLRYNQANNILPVTAVTALALSDTQKARLQAKLEEQTGKTVDLTNRIDPDILGGIRLDFDGKCVDDTLSHRLENIRHLLKNTIL
jgi:F-type H+-transporting ATPase subunit delta